MLSNEQIGWIKDEWYHVTKELCEQGYARPGEMSAPYIDEDVPEIEFEIAFPEHRVAIDSNLTVTRANLAQRWDWEVVWVDASTFDTQEIIKEAARPIRRQLTRRV